MKAFLFDVESIPRPEKEMLSLMPREILNPGEPDLSKCPEYRGDLAKQEAWKEKTRSEHVMAAAEAKQKWISDAALHAPRGQTKIIGIRDVRESLTRCIVIDATEEEKAEINSVKTWPCKVNFVFASERDALDCFHQFVHTKLGMSERGTLIGYYISGFDFPFLLRRAMIIGAKVAKKLRKGRYFDNDLYIDLDEEYKMGEKDLKIGGLTGLSKILGVPEKDGSGEGFYRIWRDDPPAAVLYHLKELDVIEACAKKMGVI